MSTGIQYAQARATLAASTNFYEVQDIRIMAEALTARARHDRDGPLMAWASELRARAERRTGELLQLMLANGTRAKSGGTLPKREAAKQLTLTQLGLSKTQSSCFIRLAAIPETEFEAALVAVKKAAGWVPLGRLLNKPRATPSERKPTPARKRMTAREKELRAELKGQNFSGQSMLSMYARLLLAALRTQQHFSEAERELLAQLKAAIQQSQHVKGNGNGNENREGNPRTGQTVA